MSAQSAGFYGSLTDLYGQNFQQLGGRGMPQQWIGAPGPMFDIDPVRRILAEERLTDECMQAKGYVRKS